MAGSVGHFLVGGGAWPVRPARRKGGTPTRGWWHCPRHGARPFGNSMPLPRLLLRTLCEPLVWASFDVGRTGGLTNRASYSNTGGPPLPRKRAPLTKKTWQNWVYSSVVR